jgi:hypothetical protein
MATHREGSHLRLQQQPGCPPLVETLRGGGGDSLWCEMPVARVSRFLLHTKAIATSLLLTVPVREVWHIRVVRLGLPPHRRDRNGGTLWSWVRVQITFSWTLDL